MDDYREIAPSGVLRKYVECFWFRNSTASGESSHRVLPDGCIDIVMNFNGDWEREDARGRVQNKDRAYAIGAMTQPVNVITRGRADFFGIRFHPGMAQPILRFPAAEFTDQSARLEDILGNEASLLVEQLAEQNPQQRASILERSLNRRLANAATPDPRVQFAVDSIRNSRGTVSISEMCSVAGISRQHLARLFQLYVGITPKLLCRIFRFHSVLQRMKAKSNPDWAEAAAGLGYYDQPHLILDFKEFSGMTPSDYLRSA